MRPILQTLPAAAIVSAVALFNHTAERSENDQKALYDSIAAQVLEEPNVLGKSVYADVNGKEVAGYVQGVHPQIVVGLAENVIPLSSWLAHRWNAVRCGIKSAQNEANITIDRNTGDYQVNIKANGCHTYPERWVNILTR